ncbi:MAG: hypothetical protein ABIO79_04960 [Ferruginibacter sp.]
MKVFNGIFIIAGATFLSFVIANIPKGSDQGLGGLILLLWPPILGVLSIILFLIICAVTKDKESRILTLILLGFYLIYAGLGLHIDKGWPLVSW